jgi:hypothetical protein
MAFNSAILFCASGVPLAAAAKLRAKIAGIRARIA